MVIAKTLDGDLGVLTGHSPVLGILAEGSLVRILDPEAGEEAAGAGEDVLAAVSSGFLAVADDRVSILSRAGPAGLARWTPAPSRRSWTPRWRAPPRWRRRRSRPR